MAETRGSLPKMTVKRLSEKTNAEFVRKMDEVERAEPSRGAPNAALQALRQWEADTEAPARANEGNAFIDGFQAGRAGHVVLLEALKAAKREMVGLAAYMETCEPSVIVDNLPSLAKALNLKVDGIEAAIQKAGGI